jgi:DNA-binding LacI/PurR family transcriptional regulator
MDIEKPDAIISSSILLTMGIVVLCRKLNIRIPQDLAIIGFGNHLNSLIMQPQLTSIYQSETSIAEISFLLLEKLINKEIPIGENYTETVNAQIVYRESC